MHIILALSLLVGLVTGAAAQQRGTWPCVGDGKGNNTNPAAAPFDYFQGNTEFWAYNNDGFIAAATGTNFSTSITVNPSTFPDGTVITWSFPSNSGGSYPEVAWGAQWGGCYPSPNGMTPTPFQIKNITDFTGTFDISLGGDLASYAVTWEGFLTSAPNNAIPGIHGGKGTVVWEVGIVLHPYPGWVDWGLGHPHYTYTDGNFSAVIAYNIDIGIPHLLISVFPTNGDMLSGTINIGGILHSLIDHGIISGHEYLGGWELGAEPQRNSGSLTINHLSYTWNGTPSPQR